MNGLNEAINVNATHPVRPQMKDSTTTLHVNLVRFLLGGK